MKKAFILLFAMLMSLSIVVVADDEDKPLRVDMSEDEVIPLEDEVSMSEEVAEDEGVSIEGFKKQMDADSKSIQEDISSASDDLDGTLSEEDSAEISKYFDEASKNYEEILRSRPDKEIENNDRRIQANKSLLKSNSGKLQKTESAIRKVKLSYIRRFLIVKNAYKKGHIDKKTYDQKLKSLSKEYDFKVRSLKEDQVFYDGELNRTKKRMVDLKEKNRINKILRHQETGYKKAKKKKRPASELEKMMHKLQSIGCFEVESGWKAKDRK